MKIMKTLVGIADEPLIVTADTIAHEQKLWIVPQWLVSPRERCTRPARLIRIDILAHQKIDKSVPNRLSADYCLNVPIPRSVLDGKTAVGFEVQEAPDIKIQADDRLH